MTKRILRGVILATALVLVGCSDNAAYQAQRDAFYSDPSISTETKLAALRMENDNWNAERAREAQGWANLQNAYSNAALAHALQPR